MANNRIQIKRSTTTAITNTTPSVNAGELVFTSNGYILAIGDPANSANVIAIGGARFPGVLTANQALVANTTSGIDKVIVANLAANSVWANGSAGSAGQVLTSNGTIVYWNNPAPGVTGSDTQVQFNDGGSLGADPGFTYNKTTDTLTVNGAFTTGGTGTGTGGTIQNTTTMFIGNNTINTVITSAGLTVNGATIANNTGVYTGIVNAASHNSGAIGTGAGGFSANTTTVLVGNNTINTNITSTTVAVANSTTSATISPLSLLVGNSTVNSIHNSSAFAVTGNTTTLASATLSSSGLLVGNSTTTQTTSIISIANTTGSANISPAGFSGNGFNLTINAANVTSGTLPDARLSSAVVNTSGSFTLAGNTTLGGSNTVISSNLTVSGSFVNASSYNAGAIGAGAGGSVQNSTAIFVGNNTLNTSITAAGLVVNGTAVIANNSGVFTTGTVNGATLSVGTSVVANSTRLVLGTAVGLQVNGTIGTAGQILYSNGTTGYWAAAPIGTINTVTAANGLVGGGSSGSVQLDVGAGNGIFVSADAVAVLANGSSGLIANATGVHVKTGVGIVFDGSGNVAVNTAALSFQDLTVSGNLTVLGDLVSLNVATLSVEDSLITLAKDQGSTATFTDALDIGFFGTYGNTANLFYSGLFRDQSDSGTWKLFVSNGAVTNTNVDTANTNAFRLGTLQAFLTSGGLTTNSTSANIIANSTYTVGISANAISLSGRANNDLLFINSTSGITGLALGTSGFVLQSNGTAIVYDTLDGGTF